MENETELHVFCVDIPRAGDVLIAEQKGDLLAPRVCLPRRVWEQIAKPARRTFNARLKAAGHKTIRWRVGKTLIERQFGRELCVLAWACEQASDAEIPIIIARWTALRPEERWWLYFVTVVEAGSPQDAARGWRRALHAALADGNQRDISQTTPPSVLVN